MKFPNLLRGLSNSDYDNLIGQVEYEAKGNEIYYVIDADLIRNYCFPLGLGKKERLGKKITNDYLSDEQTTLHSLFYLPAYKNKVLLLDQHFYELEGMLYVASLRGSTDLERASKLFEKPELKKETKVVEVLFESFTEMLAKILISINGSSKAMKLLDQGRIKLNSSELKSAKCKNIVNSCMPTVARTRYIKECMKGLGKNVFASHERDAAIIDRIFQFNESAKEEDDDGSKNIRFILLSNADIISKTIAYLVRVKSDFLFSSPELEFNSFNRSTAQIFAYTICLGYGKNGQLDYEQTLGNLRRLKKASEELNNRFNRFSDKFDVQESEITTGDYFSNYRAMRNAYENSGLLMSFNPLFDSVKDFISKDKDNSIYKIFYKFKKLGNDVFEEIRSKHVVFLRELIKIGEFNTAFIYGISSIESDIESFDLTKGGDCIEGMFQHLPLYLTFNNWDEEYRLMVLEIQRLVLTRNVIDSKLLCVNLRELFNLIRYSKYDEEYNSELNILKAFLLMILPGEQNDVGVKENDLLAVSWLENVKVAKEDTESMKNKYYLQIWAMRRVNRFRKAISLAKLAISKYPDDPRFYHGLFLAQFCLSSDENHSDHNLVITMLDNLESSMDRYYDFVTDSFFANSIVDLVYDSIEQSYNNNYGYMNALLASFVKNKGDSTDFEFYMDEARRVFNYLKNENGEFYDNLSEYYDTEAFIEYLESFIVENKLSKLKYAKDAILKARQLSNSHPQLLKKYINRSKMIDERIKFIKSTD